MYAYLATFLSIILCLFLPAPLPAADSIPICYWQLIDESRYIFRFDMERFNWREIRKIREENKTAGQATKIFQLNVTGPPADMGNAAFKGDDYLNQADILVRDPDGIISQVKAFSAKEKAVRLPSDSNLIGRYLLGARIRMGEYDVDGDTITESVYLCPKYLVAHYKNGGRMGRASVVFFDDGEKMPLEIGPAISTAKSKFGGVTQMPHRTYEMMVKYAGRPLPKTRVTVVAEGSQWEKTFETDENGKFEIMPTDDRFIDREWQKYLYTTSHHDRQTRTYYVATLPMVIYKNRPEWRSKAMGFSFWSIVGTVVTLLMVAGFTRRRKRRDRQLLIVFKNRKIQKDRP